MAIMGSQADAGAGLRMTMGSTAVGPVIVCL